MNEKFKYLNWKEFLEIRLGGGVKLDGSVEIVLQKLKFFENFGELIAKTPGQTIANYLFWKICDTSKTYMSDRMNEPGLRFYSKVFRLIRINQRWKRCVSSSQSLFSVAFASLIARNSKIRTNQETEEILSLVKEESLNYVRSALNISETDSIDLTRRLANTHVLVGPRKEFFNDEILEEYYKEADVVEGENFRNILKMEHFVKKKVGERLFKSVAETIWQSHVDNFFGSTFYSLDKKYIYFGSSELRSPYYDANLPSYLNFAGFGYVVANNLAFAIENEVNLTLQLVSIV